jgi:hemerythrin-like domain-containing protein
MPRWSLGGRARLAARLLLLHPRKGVEMPNQSDRSQGEKNEKKGILGRIAASVSGKPDAESPDAPSATELLKSQHDEVRGLFKQYESSGENAHASRKRLIDQASDQLEIHAELEERIFYPACRELEDEDARRMVGESLEEHLIVKRLIKELRGLSGSDEKFESKATVLKESVEHHADEEEKDLFPPAEKEFGAERLAELGAKMVALKTRLQRAGSAGRAKSSRTPSGKAART